MAADASCHHQDVIRWEQLDATAVSHIGEAGRQTSSHRMRTFMSNKHHTSCIITNNAPQPIRIVRTSLNKAKCICFHSLLHHDRHNTISVFPQIPHYLHSRKIPVPAPDNLLKTVNHIKVKKVRAEYQRELDQTVPVGSLTIKPL